MKPTAIRIEPARERDTAEIHDMIEALADHMGLSHQVVATEADLREALFGAQPQAEVLIARAGDEAAGFALYYNNYSTFRGRCGIHLEDLFVHDRWRGEGIGRYLLAYLANLTLRRGCSRLEWWVLASDENVVSFYEAIGATAKGEWNIYRLHGKALTALAQEADQSKGSTPS